MTKNKDEIRITADDAPQEGAERKVNVVQANAEVVVADQTIISFRNRAMVQMPQPFPHFIPLTKELFDRIAYPLLGGVTRSRMADVYAFICNRATDFTGNEHLILFGVDDWSDGSYQDYFAPHTTTRVWDMEQLEFVERSGDECIWRSPYGVVEPTKPIPFIMSLAGGSQELYDDIMQSLAPLVMAKKPDGVIWWVGDGANGKSTLMDAVYRIFPGQLASLTVKSLVDQRDTVRLNGTLANVVKESSEGRIEDTEIYKAVGTHEDFSVHKFHSQDTITIRGNLHHIFSANSIPSFNDKGFSARRRTFIVPFTQRFESDPLFEEKTFTAEMFSQLIGEMCRYAQRIKKQGYRYKWSAITLAAKADYDTDANNAEEYAKYLVNAGVVAFDSYTPVQRDYEQWCSDNGFVPLGVTNLRRALSAVGFIRTSTRDNDDRIGKMYRIPIGNANPSDLQEYGMAKPGMYTIPGFKPEPTAAEKTRVPDFPEPKEDDPDPEPEKPKTILNGKW